ncbi:hypothetical protein [Plasmodium yoelii yoelii]|uniref:Uncharacterized protein n=1 Tax=Plasmodium yoelii yoelii TaxID=73239 RepID=Q7RH59_PLAYO|nr:hypothetical protein [Plasmodium yoelii yoelii]
MGVQIKNKLIIY